jgi:hypothetical protein
MSFSDLPIIDRFSINSETSERRFKEVINLITGFQTRPEYPDKGCDLTVELVVDRKSASSWLFPVQLKSIEKLVLVHEKTMISLPFETSRLGYLMRRLPAMGLVVFYSLEEDRCFFEYADQVYDRLMEERNSHDWKENNEVNIHIPYCNKLTPETAKEIYQVFLNRFQQAEILQNSHGKKYGLPIFSSSQDFQYDFKNPDHIKRFLKEYGMSLVNDHDVDLIYQMISKIPHMEIYGSKELLLIAAIAYAECGLYAESKTFCHRLSKQILDGSEKLMFDFITLKNNLSLGYIDSETFLSEIQKLKGANIGTHNELVLRLNIEKYLLLAIKPLEVLPDKLVQNLNLLFSDITSSNLDRKKKSALTLINCGNFSDLINHFAGQKLADHAIKEALGNPPSKERRLKDAIELMQMETRLHNIIQGIIKEAGNPDDKSLRAQAFSLSVFHFLQQQINLISFGIPPADKMEEMLAHKVDCAGTAYNYFMELHSFKEAYDNICNMLEILDLAQQYYNIQEHPNKSRFVEMKAKMELDYDFPPREMLVKKLMAQKVNQEVQSNQNGMPIFKGFSDKQIENLAVQMQSTMSLSEESLVHIINEIKAYRLFHQRCSDPNIEIHQLQPLPMATQSYTRPIVFILRNKTTGIQTVPSAIMDELLTAIGF